MPTVICCDALHAFVGVCVWACTRRVLTVIAVMRCIRVWECVFSHERGVCSQRLRMCMLVCVSVPMNKAYGQGHSCEAMHVYHHASISSLHYVYCG